MHSKSGCPCCGLGVQSTACTSLPRNGWHPSLSGVFTTVSAVLDALLCWGFGLYAVVARRPAHRHPSSPPRHVVGLPLAAHYWGAHHPHPSGRGRTEVGHAPLTPRSPRAPGGLVALVASIYLGVALAWVHPRCAHAPRWGCANLGDGGSRHRRASVVCDGFEGDVASLARLGSRMPAHHRRAPCSVFSECTWLAWSSWCRSSYYALGVVRRCVRPIHYGVFSDCVSSQIHLWSGGLRPFSSMFWCEWNGV